jgi:hypothetical protein
MHTTSISPPADSSDDNAIMQFLRLEKYNAMKLVQEVHETLSALSKAIRGTALLTTQTAQLAAALLRHEVVASTVPSASSIRFSR